MSPLALDEHSPAQAARRRSPIGSLVGMSVDPRAGSAAQTPPLQYHLERAARGPDPRERLRGPAPPGTERAAQERDPDSKGR